VSATVSSGAEPVGNEPVGSGPVGSGPVGVGLIGAGVISTQYLEVLTGFPDVRVLFIADLDLDRAAIQAAAFGVAGHGSVAELLARDDVEIVVNLTIPAAHVEVGLQVLEAGKHVWSEKPIALDRDSGQRLLAAAAERGLRAACAPDTFLGAGLQSAQRLIEGGALGRPVSALALMQSAGPERWHPNPEFLFGVGAGPLFDMGPYYLTALVQNFGPVARVSATASTARPSRTIGSGPRAGTVFPVAVPTQHNALIEFESGATAVLLLSFESAIGRTLLEITGTDAAAALPDPNGFSGATSVFDPASAEPTTAPDSGPAFGRGMGVLDLARSIRAGVPERASGALAYHVLDVMISISEAAASGERVEVASSVERPVAVPSDWDPAASTLGQGTLGAGTQKREV